jgi:hypothetical protein
MVDTRSAEKIWPPSGENILPIFEMDQRHYGLTAEVAGAYCQAAYVCLERHHSSPAEFVITLDDQVRTVAVHWPQITDRVRAAWANQSDSVRDGAYAMAIAAVEMMTGLQAIGRSETLTGADYIMAEPGVEHRNFNSGIRLEVSGTELPDPVQVASRLRSKIAQLKKGKSTLRGRVCVVGFRTKSVLSQVPGKDIAEVGA